MAASLLMLAGCGGARARSEVPEAGSAEDAAREARIRQLEAQLARRERDAEAQRAAARSTESVRIGGARERDERYERDQRDERYERDDRYQREERGEREGWDDAPSDSGPRPLLTLQGDPSTSSIDDVTRQYGAPALSVTAVAPAPVLPAASPYRSAVPYAPGAAPVGPVAAPIAPIAPVPPVAPAVPPAAPVAPPPNQAAVAQYRAALVALEARDYPAAARTLSRFVEAFPEHAYVSSALYWRAEARYALRQYEAALSDFERVAREYPAESKTPDALLKAGFCHLRMGDRARAKAFFTRVRREYPESVAARLASEEDPL